MPQSRRGFLEFSKLGLLPLSPGGGASAGRSDGTTGIAIVDRLADLTGSPRTPLSKQRLAIVLGAMQPFDGGGGLYVRDARTSGAKRPEIADSSGLPSAGEWYRLVNENLSSDIPTAKLFGAIGDIKADDTDAIQKLIERIGNYAGDLGKTGYIPAGLYRLSRSLLPQNYSRVFGDGPHQSVLYNYQNPVPTIPAFKSDKGLAFSTFENLGMQSQRSGFDISGATDHNTFRDMKFYGMSDAGFHFRGPLQTSLFDRILFENCKHGLVCDDYVANRNTLREPEFKDCSNSAIKIGGAEDFLIIGGRFEGKGSTGLSILDTQNVRLLSFIGGYFEGCHEFVLKTRSSRGIISFDSVHFTYFRDGTPYKWDVDAGCRLVFRNCHSTLPMAVPPSSILEGINENIHPA